MQRHGHDGRSNALIAAVAANSRAIIELQRWAVEPGAGNDVRRMEHEDMHAQAVDALHMQMAKHAEQPWAMLGGAAAILYWHDWSVANVLGRWGNEEFNAMMTEDTLASHLRAAESTTATTTTATVAATKATKAGQVHARPE